MLLEIKEDGGQEEDIDENIGQKPQVTGLDRISEFLVIILLPHQEVEGYYAQDPKYKRHQNSLSSLEDQLVPVSLPDGKTDAHSGDKKEQRDSPDIDHRHGYPQGFQRPVALNKYDKYSPGLKGYSNMIDQEKANGYDPHPIYIVSSVCCFHFICIEDS
jgi:hypothetical protein